MYGAGLGLSILHFPSDSGPNPDRPQPSAARSAGAIVVHGQQAPPAAPESLPRSGYARDIAELLLFNPSRQRTCDCSTVYLPAGTRVTNAAGSTRFIDREGAMKRWDDEHVGALTQLSIALRLPLHEVSAIYCAELDRLATEADIESVRGVLALRNTCLRLRDLLRR